MPPALSAPKTAGQTTIGLPVQRAAQLKLLAKARKHSTLVALVEDMIHQAIEDGEIPDEVPGYAAFRSGDVIVIEMQGGVSLPMMQPLKAMLVATVLDAAAGTKNPVHEFSLATGKAIPIDLDAATLIVGRVGRGVVLQVENKATGDIQRLAEHPSIITDFARQIRKAVENA